MNTLTQAGVVYRDPRQGDYMLGYKLLQYGSKLTYSEILKERLSHYLNEISGQTNMTALLATWVNDRPIITQIANTNFGLNIGATVSTELPPLSAVGKVFAAFKDDEATELWKKNNLDEARLNELNIEIEKIKLQKFAYSKEPLIRHVSSISFPLLNYKNDIVAAVGIVGFTEDLPSTFDEPFIQKIAPIIDEMSEVFGCTDNSTKNEQ